MKEQRGKAQRSTPSLTDETYSVLVNKVRRAKTKKDEEDAFHKILTAISPRIERLCRRCKISGLNEDDILQEALFALRYKAITSYDKTKGTGSGIAPFEPFALMCITRHLATEWKTSQQVRHHAMNTAVSMDQQRSDKDDELSLASIIPGRVESASKTTEGREYLAKLAQHLLRELSDFEKEVFYLFLEKYHYEEIAEIINSRHRRRKIKSKAKGVDNALSRIKKKADQVFSRIGDKGLRIRDADKVKRRRRDSEDN